MPPEWQDGEDQWDAAIRHSTTYRVARGKYPSHFTHKMVEMYEQLILQAKMCRVHFALSNESTTDVLSLVVADLKNKVIRE